MSLIEKSLTVDSKVFETWEDADKFCVSKIFRFSEQCGNSSLSQCVELVINSSTISNNNIFAYMTFRTDNEIDFLKSIIDQYLESGLEMLEPSSFSNAEESQTVIEAHQAMFLLMAHSAIRLFDQLQNDERYKSFINVFLSESMIAETVAKKQRDYGPNNVSKFGVSGLVVRIHDKIARLDNLLSSSRNGQNSVKNETVFDTLLDIVGYSTVSLLWVNGWFLTPMSIDKR
jgi:hypothetical protein